MTVAPGRAVVVWGNCQAGPLASLLTSPLAAHGLTVVTVPPVFEVDLEGLARVHELLATAAVFVTQPVSDEYRVPGCGSDQLAALLPAGARTVRVGSAYHVGPFPYLVNGHDAAGVRVDAPLVDYHDLRLVARALGHPVSPPPTGAFRAVEATSLAELRRRESGLDVPVSALLAGVPEPLFSFNHPTNAVLAGLARGVLGVLGIVAHVPVPDREFLGAIRAPVEPPVAAELGLTPRPAWIVDGRPLPLEEIAASHLRLYRDRPDVAEETWTRYADRRVALGL